jgi:peptidoglycan/LPS O-acetylase OafA/YrhL
MATRWTSLFTGLYRTFLEVLHAELNALLADLSASGRSLGGALAFLGVAVALMLLFLGVLVVAAIAALALVLPLWGAALVLAGVLGATAGVLAWIGRRRLSAIENPAETVRRRVDSHVDWWRTHLLAERGQPHDTED